MWTDIFSCCNDLEIIYGAEAEPTDTSWHYSGGSVLSFASGVEHKRPRGQRTKVGVVEVEIGDVCGWRYVSRVCGSMEPADIAGEEV